MNEIIIIFIRIVFTAILTILTRISLIIFTRILYYEFSFDITYSGIYEKMGTMNISIYENFGLWLTIKINKDD
jgi:hypothetical protein